MLDLFVKNLYVITVLHSEQNLLNWTILAVYIFLSPFMIKKSTNSRIISFVVSFIYSRHSRVSSDPIGNTRASSKYLFINLMVNT